MHQIIIEEIVIDVTRKNIKNIRLAVKLPDGRVHISIPFHIEDEVVGITVPKQTHRTRLPKSFT